MIKKYKWLFLAILIIICIAPLSYSRYSSSINKNITLSVRKPTYTIHFYPNITGTETTYETQSLTYDTASNLRLNTFTNGSYNFKEWTTNIDGTGTKYTNGQQVNNLSSVDGDNINLYAQWVQGKAEVNGQIYESLQDAVDAVTTSTPTTVTLLTDTTEQITVGATQNIIFNLQNYTISNVDAAASVIENNGTITISNGKLWSNGNPAAINNNSGAILKMTGGEIEATSTYKGQAIYNNGGYVEISGTAYLSSKSTNRAVVHNLKNSSTNVAGTMDIKGGTIVAKGSFHAVLNDKGGLIKIGVEDGIVDKTTPVIQGANCGLIRNSSGNFEFYDGIIKGKTNAIDNENTIIVNQESGYDIVHSEETIGSATYKTAYLAITSTVTFVPTMGGTVDEASRKVENGTAVGTLPLPTNTGYIFEGWFTDATGGQEVTSSTVITGDITLYGHWLETDVAQVDTTKYSSLQAAINAVPTNTPTTVTLLRNLSENVTIANNKKIIFDFSTYTLSNYSADAVITNNGTLTINNGTISQSAAFAAINNKNNGKVIVTGGNIISTGGRSAIYSTESSTVEISGSANLVSNASGTLDLSGVTFNRGAVMNTTANNKIIITGGTITATDGIGVSNVGTLTIGTQGGQIDASSPSIQGETYGVMSSATFNFYDGIIKGITDSIDATISDQEADTQVITGSETIDTKTYITAHLEATP